MLRMTATIFFLIFALTSFQITAQADRHDRRQGAQRARIHAGKKDGSLTAGESARLRAGQRGIRRAERRAEADGVVTEAEKARLEKRQDRQSKKIHRLKHNDKNQNNNVAPVAAPVEPAAPATDPAAPAGDSAVAPTEDNVRTVPAADL